MDEISTRPEGHMHVAHKPPLAQNSWDYEQAFIEAMRLSGLNFKDTLIADGAIHRFATGGKSHKDATLYLD